MGRMQSPSSINTFRQCPRKYYYAYIQKLPTKPSINLLMGSVVHETLEEFFEQECKEAGDLLTSLQQHVLGILKERWEAHDKETTELGLTAAELVSYKSDSALMLINWLAHFWKELQTDMAAGLSFSEAFKRRTPRTEEEYRSEELQVRGFIDAIHEIDDEVHIRDYKTSRNPILTDDYKLQLAIYALLYKHNHGKVPDSVGIFFLKHGEQLLEVNDELLALADREIRWVHERTQTEDIKDYDKRPSPLCNYCDFYDECWNQKELGDFK